MRWLKHGAAALALVVAAIAGFEGFVPTPYQDQASVWTNGYGNTVGVGPSTPAVTEPEAREQLTEHIDAFQAKIDQALTRPATQGQTVAYTSLAYNIGAANFAKSSVVRLHNLGRFVEACRAILLWDKITVRGKLVPNRGLANRRAKEQAQCLIGL